MSTLDKGIAFIVEGDTEIVFYEEYLSYLADSIEGDCRLGDLDELGETAYLFKGPLSTFLIRFHSSDTITQIPNSVTWFREACVLENPDLPWCAFLAYDTDGYKASITKFHQGDWERMRTALARDGCTVFDLAASADIEDVMLEDYQGVLRFLGLDSATPMPSGGKGKSKMRKLFRMVAPNNAYREGRKARSLIQALDMPTIERKTLVPLATLRTILSS